MPNSNYNEVQSFPVGKLLETSSIFLYHCDITEGFPIRYMSDNVQNILGFPKERFINNDVLWLDRVHPNDLTKVKTEYHKATRQKQTMVEFRFKHADGHYVWIRDELALITDDDGQPESIVGTSFDITAQKEAEANLQELNQTLEKRVKERTNRLISANQKLKDQHETLKLQEKALENLNDFVVITKAPKKNPLASKIIFVNEAFEQFTGYEASEVLGEPPTFLHGEKTSSRIIKKINDQICLHQPLHEEFINYKKDGTPFWSELSLAPFSAPETGYEYWIGINRDITERKRAEDRLKESEQLYRAFAELSFDAIFEIDREGRILNCNKRACELFKYSSEELLGMNMQRLRSGKKQQDWDSAVAAIREACDRTLERTYRKRDGSTFPAEVHAQLYQNGQETELLIVYISDNTAHEAYKDQTQRSLREKETLLAEIHHRVKNNLAIISGLLDMQAFNANDQRLTQKLRERQSRIKSMAMVPEKLYRSETFSEIAFDQYIDDLLDTVTNSLARTDKNISVKKDLDHVLLTVNQAIPCGLLINELLTNSYKHAFSNRSYGSIHITLKQENKMVKITVEDDGAGLPDDFNIENESTLGMTLINTLTTQLDGRLDISSEAGSSFSLSFKIDS